MTVEEQLVELKSRLVLLEKRFDLLDRMHSIGASLSGQLKDFQNTVNALMLKNHELTEALAALHQGRDMPKELKN